MRSIIFLLSFIFLCMSCKDFLEGGIEENNYLYLNGEDLEQRKTQGLKPGQAAKRREAQVHLKTIVERVKNLSYEAYRYYEENSTYIFKVYEKAQMNISSSDEIIQEAKKAGDKADEVASKLQTMQSAQASKELMQAESFLSQAQTLFMRSDDREMHKAVEVFQAQADRVYDVGYTAIDARYELIRLLRSIGYISQEVPTAELIGFLNPLVQAHPSDLNPKEEGGDLDEFSQEVQVLINRVDLAFKHIEESVELTKAQEDTVEKKLAQVCSHQGYEEIQQAKSKIDHTNKLIQNKREAELKIAHYEVGLVEQTSREYKRWITKMIKKSQEISSQAISI